MIDLMSDPIFNTLLKSQTLVEVKLYIIYI